MKSWEGRKEKRGNGERGGGVNGTKTREDFPLAALRHGLDLKWKGPGLALGTADASIRPQTISLNFHFAIGNPGSFLAFFGHDQCSTAMKSLHRVCDVVHHVHVTTRVQHSTTSSPSSMSSTRHRDRQINDSNSSSKVAPVVAGAQCLGS